MMPLAVFFVFCSFPVADLLADTAPSAPPQSLAVPNSADIRDIKEIIPLTDSFSLWYGLGGCTILVLLLSDCLFLALSSASEKESSPKHTTGFTGP